MSKEVEIWKDIPGYEGLYQVSNLGRVKSLKYNKERILKCGINTHGYNIVVLCDNGKPKTKNVHQLVAMSFLNHNPCGFKLVIDHKNDIKTDNRLENLQIVTSRFNNHKTQGKYSSKYKGVYWNVQKKKWRSQINIKNRLIWLGDFKCELAASYAYQKALKEYEQKIN